MRARVSSRLSAGHVLSLGMFCGLLIIPLSSFLFRSLIQAFRRKRKESLPGVPSYPIVRTERGAIIHVAPQPLGKREREAARFSIVLRDGVRQNSTSQQRRRSPRLSKLAKLPERQGIPC